MRAYRTLVAATVLFVLGSAPRIVSACVSAYTDFNVDTAQNELEAWAYVDDWFAYSPCFEQAYYAWYYWEHTYEASVNIVSPTQNSVYDVDHMANVPYGGGSAYAFATISTLDDPGEYEVDWLFWIWCILGGLFVQGGGSDVVDVPPSPVTIEYTMLIPLDHVRMPAPYSTMFGADGVPTHTPGAFNYRINQTFVIFPASKTVSPSANQSGVSYAYSPSDEHVTSAGSCFRKFCPECPDYITGRKIVHSGYCRVTGGHYCDETASDMATMQVVVTGSTSTSVTARFNGDPSNACVSPFAWDISWLNEITISWDTGAPQYEIDMDHDGFPLHELRINGTKVYGFDPIAAGNTPNALAWPRDVQAQSSGQLP